MKNIYKITHLYAVDDNEFAFFLETELNHNEMIDILATVMFRFEELVNEFEPMLNESLIEILEAFYPIKDVSKKYRKYLPQTQLNKNEWRLLNHIPVENPLDSNLKNVFIITQIDLYMARETSCGHKYKQLMLGELANSKEFISKIKKAKIEGM